MIGWARLPRGHTIASRFVIRDLLGRGQSAAVYRAFDSHTRSDVAVKILDPVLAQDPIAVGRFAREVQAMRGLDHPHVVKLYDVLQDGDLHVLCMELVDGMDARRLLERGGRVPLSPLLRIASQATSALDACHRRGILHRDVKPQNLLVTAAGDVKLVDFGVARMTAAADLTKTGTILGTAAYMAPEQFVTGRSDPRADVFSLGVVLYELLAGRLPHAGVARRPPEALATVRPDVPAWLDAVIRRCLEPEPDRRYQSARALAHDLDLAQRAAALREQDAPPLRCLECTTEAIPVLPFCHRCGTFRDAVYEAGPDSLVLYSCEEPAALREQLCRLAPVRDPEALERALREPPVVLLRNVSSATAAAVLAECVRVPGELRIVRDLSREFHVPRVYLGFAILLLIPLWAFGSVAGRLAFTGVVAAALALAWSWRVRPLIRPPARGTATAASRDAFLIEAAAALRDVGEPQLQSLLGRVVAAFVRAQAALARGPAAVRPDELQALVRQALRAGPVLAGWETHLAATTLGELKARAHATALRLEEAHEPHAVARLVDEKALLAREIATYRAIQDQDTRVRVALVNLAATLEQLSDELAAHGPVEDVLGELSGLAAVLTEPEPTSLAVAEVEPGFPATPVRVTR